MINKYAEIQDRIMLYNACKGILRVKTAGIGSLMAGIGINPNTGGLQSQEHQQLMPQMSDDMMQRFKRWKEMMQQFKPQQSNPEDKQKKLFDMVRTGLV